MRPVRSSLGTSLLTSAPASQPLRFTQVPPSNTQPTGAQMPKGFIYVTAAEPAPREPVRRGEGRIGPPPPTFAPPPGRGKPRRVSQPRRI